MQHVHFIEFIYVFESNKHTHILIPNIYIYVFPRIQRIQNCRNDTIVFNVHKERFIVSNRYVVSIFTYKILFKQKK